MTLLVLLKIGLSGLACFLFLKRVHKADSRALLFSSSYALIGYVAAYFHNIMWLDGVVFLPMLALGIWRIAEDRRPFAYVFWLALSLLSNFYVGYMLCIFSVLYFLLILLAHSPVHGHKPLLRVCGRFAAGSLLAGGLAAVILLPSYFYLSKSFSMFASEGIALSPMFPIMDYANKLFTGAFDFEQSRYGLPNIFIGMPLTVLAVLFLLNPKLSRRQRITTCALLGVFLLSFQVNLLYLLWHGLDKPQCFPARFSFLFSFLLIEMAWQSFSSMTRQDVPGLSRRLAACCGGMLIFTALLFQRGLPAYIAYETLLLDVLSIASVCGLMYALRPRGRYPRAALCAFCVLQAVSLVMNGYLSIRRQEQVNQTTASAFTAETSTVQDAVDQLKALDGGLYRIEKNFSRVENDPMQYNFAGISHYSSAFDQPTADFLRALGIYQSYYRILYGASQTPVIDSVFGIRYLLYREGASIAALPDFYEMLFSHEGIEAYRNPYALPMAYMVPLAGGKEDLFSGEDPFLNQNALLSDLVGETVTPFTPVAGIAAQYVGVEQVAGKADTYRVTNRSGAGITYTIPVAAGERVYFDSEGGHFTLNGQYLSPGKFYGCTALPVLDIPVTYTLHVYAPEDAMYTRQSPWVYAFDEGELERAYTRVKDPVCQIIRAKNAGDAHLLVSAEATQGRSQLLLTIPADPAWRVTVDGARAESTARYGALLALDLEPGIHSVELSYVPQGMGIGVALSLACFVLTMSWAFVPALLRRRGSKQG